MLPSIDLGPAAHGARTGAASSRECLPCEAPVPRSDGEALVCGVCRSRWRRVAPPHCARCGGTLPPEGGCGFCADWPDALGRVWAAVWLDEGARAGGAPPQVRRLVAGLRGGGDRHAAGAAAAGAERAGADPAGAAAPAHPRIQPGRAARGGAARLGGHAVRHRPAAAGAGDRHPDRAHAGGARARTCPGRSRPPGASQGRVVLVDDVSRPAPPSPRRRVALVGAGAARVEAVTFARARPPGTMLA